MLPSLSAAAAGPLAFPRGKKRGMAKRTVLLPAAIMAAVLMIWAPGLMVVES
jgi:hypothetical protein